MFESSSSTLKYIWVSGSITSYPNKKNPIKHSFQNFFSSSDPPKPQKKGKVFGPQKARFFFFFSEGFAGGKFPFLPGNVPPGGRDRSQSPEGRVRQGGGVFGGEQWGGFSSLGTMAGECASEILICLYTWNPNNLAPCFDWSLGPCFGGKRPSKTEGRLGSRYI